MITADEAIALTEEAIGAVSVVEFDDVIRRAAAAGHNKVNIGQGNQRMKRKLEQLGYTVQVAKDKTLVVGW
jgi:hypothetical protein